MPSTPYWTLSTTLAIQRRYRRPKPSMHQTARNSSPPSRKKSPASSPKPEPSNPPSTAPWKANASRTSTTSAPGGSALRSSANGRRNPMASRTSTEHALQLEATHCAARWSKPTFPYQPVTVRPSCHSHSHYSCNSPSSNSFA
jgi:hypothetical protein